MAFILPKSKHGSTRLYALWLAQDQNPGTSQITSAFLPFSSPQDDCVTPFLSLCSLSPSPPSLQGLHPTRIWVHFSFLKWFSVPCFFFPHNGHHELPLFHPAPLLFHRLIWTLWTLLRRFGIFSTISSTYFLRGGLFQLLLEVRDMLTRSSSHCFLVDWSQNQAVPAQGCL